MCRYLHAIYKDGLKYTHETTKQNTSNQHEEPEASHLHEFYIKSINIIKHGINRIKL